MVAHRSPLPEGVAQEPAHAEDNQMKKPDQPAEITVSRDQAAAAIRAGLAELFTGCREIGIPLDVAAPVALGVAARAMALATGVDRTVEALRQYADAFEIEDRAGRARGDGSSPPKRPDKTASVRKKPRQGAAGSSPFPSRGIGADGPQAGAGGDASGSARLPGLDLTTRRAPGPGLPPRRRH